MPWVRLHALKDYLDMVEVLSDYPDLHQTFNLVPSLVEQLEDYSRGGFSDVCWDHTIKPADELDPVEQAFVLERMCESPEHPRARSHPRYLELALKRAAHASPDWLACAAAFTVDELRDLQVWFNLAWFEPTALAAEPLRALVDRGRDFREEDKLVLATVQTDILARTLPAYRDAAQRGQIELSTSPYFHPILPLLCNSDAARIASTQVILPRRRFSHPEDASDQIQMALRRHETVFGQRPRGIWCSEQAVGEDLLALLNQAGFAWTISDEGVLARSVAGTAAGSRFSHVMDLSGPASAATVPGSPYFAYRLSRETGELAMVFRDHVLSDLVGFEYRSWDSHSAAGDVLRRLRALRDTLLTDKNLPAAVATRGVPLVTIALDGENAWEYYPKDGRDFLRYLYEGLDSDPSLRCVTISEHLRESPALIPLDWLHTGSWISADLLTWTGDGAQCAAWDMLHDARDMVAHQRSSVSTTEVVPIPADPTLQERHKDAWHHILIAEGSDWFWWFGDHHHTELDPVWDLGFRLHLQEAYHLLGLPAPTNLLLPILGRDAAPRATLPGDRLVPNIDGLITHPDEWEPAGFLAADLPGVMQRSSAIRIEEVRFGWRDDCLCLMVRPYPSALAEGLELEIRVTWPETGGDLAVHLVLEDKNQVAVRCEAAEYLTGPAVAAWSEVIEVSVPLDWSTLTNDTRMGLVVRIGRGGMTERVFHSADLTSIRWREQ